MVRPRFLHGAHSRIGKSCGARDASSGLARAAAKLADPDIKDALRRNTENAIGRGVFGVPTAIVDGELFWGFDATEMLFEYCSNPRMFADTEMQRVSALPIAAARVPARK